MFSSQEQKDKMRNRKALIDKLMFSEGPADQIVTSHKRDLQQQAEAAQAASSVPRQRHTQFSSGNIIVFGAFGINAKYS